MSVSTSYANREEFVVVRHECAIVELCKTEKGLPMSELSELEVDAFLADSVVSAENKLYVQGAGWDTIYTAAFPFRQPRIGIGVVLRVPWAATNQMHVFAVKIVDSDENPLTIAPAPAGLDLPDGVIREVRGQFNLGRPPLLGVGDSQVVPIAINLDGLEFVQPNNYSVVISVDGEDKRRLPLHVSMAPQMVGVGQRPQFGG